MNDDLLSNSVTAQTLSELLTDKTPTQWALWLQNNRNQQRTVGFRIPFVKMAGGVFYRREDITNYAELEKSRQLGTIKLSGRAKEALDAFGIGTATGSATGQKLTVTGINPQTDEATGKPYIQFITSDPLRVFRLEIDEAQSIAKELDEALRCCTRTQKPLVYTEVSNNASMQILRKVKES